MLSVESAPVIIEGEQALCQSFNLQPFCYMRLACAPSRFFKTFSEFSSERERERKRKNNLTLMVSHPKINADFWMRKQIYWRFHATDSTVMDCLQVANEPVFARRHLPHVLRLHRCVRPLYTGTLTDDLMDSRGSPRGLWLNGFSGAGQHGAL